ATRVQDRLTQSCLAVGPYCGARCSGAPPVVPGVRVGHTMSAMPTRRTVLQVVAASVGVIGSAGGAAALASAAPAPQPNTDKAKTPVARGQYHCSFCGKSQDQVHRLIAGPGAVFICDECVDLCRQIIEDESAPPVSTGRATDRFARFTERARKVVQLD